MGLFRRKREPWELSKREEAAIRRKAEFLMQEKEHRTGKLENYLVSELYPHMAEGFFYAVMDEDTYERHEQKISENENMLVHKFEDGMIIFEVAPEYLIDTLRGLDPECPEEEDFEECRFEANVVICDFEKYLIEKGKRPEGFEGTIAIYSMTQRACTPLEGIQYRAFRLNMNQTLEYLSRYGYSINVQGEYLKPSEAIRVNDALWKSVIPSPARLGAFIKIRYDGTVDQMLVMEKEFHRKYGVERTLEE